MHCLHMAIVSETLVYKILGHLAYIKLICPQLYEMFGLSKMSIAKTATT